MNEGFSKGTSVNLPKIDLEMFMDYLSSNDCFYSAEMRGTKSLRSMRPGYGDSAIGYVQVQRQGDLCTIKARVSPEHKLRNKNYTVSVVVNEKSERILKAECQDCAAALGGCKHAVAFVAWVYRRTEEPSPTSVACYWQKPKLSSVGTTLKYKLIRDCVTAQNKFKISERSDANFLNLVLTHKTSTDPDSHLVKFYKRTTPQTLSLHFSAVTFSGDRSSTDKFLKFCATFLTVDNCKSASISTIDQSESNVWYELRYGRITASTVYEAAQCQTSDGCLTEKIMSAKMNYDSLAMQRGRKLEGCVIDEYVKTFKKQVRRCGLLLNREFPMLGASPDGVTDTDVIEVKCPSHERNIQNYVNKGRIQKKFRAQLHMQMLFAEKRSGYFCIADPDFEKTKKVTFIREEFDAKFIMPVIEKASNFWKEAIFPILMKCAST